MTVARASATHRIRVSGTVQGVGFRPFVYREATRRNLVGWVRNTPAGVEIAVNGDADRLDEFERSIRSAAPPAARVCDIAVDAIDEILGCDTFRIADSDTSGPRDATVTADIATCPDCLAEINDPRNRRHRYPFTNCTNCGPRYSIMNTLPYDRGRTTMETFRMCPACQREFDDPGDRRFHAQPNACPVCGPQLALWDREGHTIAAKDDALRQAAAHLREGRVVAVKGLGGFHLMADAANGEAVRTLRARKHREAKPFAVMVPDIAAAERLAEISDEEREWLAGPVAPIVLLKKVEGMKHSDAVAPDNPRIGLFLPYTPLHHLLMQEVGRPLVATSGNLSDEPICTDGTEAVERLGAIADFFLVHNRPIAHPIDDSVMRIVADRPLFLRVARGLAPLALDVEGLQLDCVTLGTGPHMKATIALGRGGRVTVSPHIGDLETIPAWQAYRKNLDTLTTLYDADPECVVCDAHPEYATTRHAERHFADRSSVQHHYAHVLAVMAEHNLAGPVLGVAWDGTGYGDDGTIWGGEFLVADRSGYRRVAHLRPFPLPGGDAAAREPRRSALGLLHAMGRAGDADGFTDAERRVLAQAIDRGVNTVMTSSMGRLFDAVASLLGICHASSYEGHAAMMLQASAEGCEHSDASYPFAAGDILDWAPMVDQILADKMEGMDVSRIAARFHATLIEMIRTVANAHPGLPVVLCGGCFQNAWLLEHAEAALADRPVYRPLRLPPNDGAVAFGQLVAARPGGAS